MVGAAAIGAASRSNLTCSIHMRRFAMSSVPKATPVPAARLLKPDDHTLILIDFQSQMAFPVRSLDVGQLRSNAALISDAAAGFSVATILTTVAARTFSGPMFDEIHAAFPRSEVIDRTTMNALEDKRITDQVNGFGKSKLVLAGLWTSVCIVDPALSALEQGFDVYVITDACGDVSSEAHDRAVQRMIQAGAQPMTSLQYLLELQRDWARGDTYELTTGIAKKHAGGYGLGITYANAMFGAKEGK
jgi:nicotinamidase-related amidase